MTARPSHLVSLGGDVLQPCRVGATGADLRTVERVDGIDVVCAEAVRDAATGRVGRAGAGSCVRVPTLRVVTLFTSAQTEWRAAPPPVPERRAGGLLRGSRCAQRRGER